MYKRTVGTLGFASTWEGASERLNSVFVIHVRAYERNGLSFITPSEEITKSVRFDGKDYPNQGPNVPPGSGSSGRRVNLRTLQLTDKLNGKTMATEQINLSPDHKTLTMTVHAVGRSEPNILVFDRE